MISIPFSSYALSKFDNSELISSSIQSWSGFKMELKDNIPEKRLSKLYGALRAFIRKCDVCNINGYSISVCYDEKNNKFDFHVHKLPEKLSQTAYV